MLGIFIFFQRILQIPHAVTASSENNTSFCGLRRIRPIQLIHWWQLSFILYMSYSFGPGWRLATGWTVRRSNPGGDEIFRTRPYRPWVTPSLLYNGYRVSFPGRGVDHPSPSSAEVKERVELYLYSPSGPSWPVPGRTYFMSYSYCDNMTWFYEMLIYFNKLILRPSTWHWKPLSQVIMCVDKLAHCRFFYLCIAKIRAKQHHTIRII
jgi:hypothetical protein